MGRGRCVLAAGVGRRWSAAVSELPDGEVPLGVRLLTGSPAGDRTHDGRPDDRRAKRADEAPDLPGTSVIFLSVDRLPMAAEKHPHVFGALKLPHGGTLSSVPTATPGALGGASATNGPAAD